MTNSYRPFRPGIGLAAIAAAVGGLTAAQPAAAQLEEIRVTAERRDASLQDVPLAVTALDQQQLQQLQITDALDLQRAVPSLNMFNNITQPTNLSPSLRGGLQQDASLVTAESPFGIYVDDIYVGRLNGNNVALSDIERIEVLRGPQGTLYGRNTGYGAIKFVSRTPDADGEGWFDARAGVGNFDQYILGASVGGRIADGWGGSLAGQFRNKDEQFDNRWDGSESGLMRDYAVRGKLRYQGTERLDVILSASFTDAENDSNQMGFGITPGIPQTCAGFTDGLGNPIGCDASQGRVAQFTTDDLVFPNGDFGVNYPTFPFGPAPLRDRQQAETQQTILGLTVAYDIAENLTFKSITGYVDTQDFFHTDFSGNSGAGLITGTAPSGFTGGADIDNQQYSQELQLLGSAFDDRLNFLVGAFYLREEGTQQFGWFFGGPLSQSFIDVETDSIALFGEGTYQITDRLSATLGLRWTDESKDFSFDYFGPFNLAQQTQVELEAEFDEWTPRIGLDYTLDSAGPLDSGLVYAQAARGFKGAGFSAIALFSTDPVGVYDPEINWTYEIGFKGEWLGNRLRTNFAYFFSDIEGIQQNSTGPPPQFEFPVENNGDAEIQGLEFEIIATPIDGLNVFLNGSFLDGEYKNLDQFPGGAAANAERLYGLPPETPQTPDFQYSIGFDYTVEMPGDLLGAFTFGADYYEIDEYMTAATNDFRNSGWNLVNAFLSLDVGQNWQVRFSGKNLQDDYIITSGSRGLGGFVPLPPREFLLSVNYRGAGFGGR